MRSNLIKQPPLNIIDAFDAREQARKEGKLRRLMDDRLAMAYVALSAIVLSFSTLMPVVPILVLYGLWFSQPLQKGLSLLHLTRPCFWLMVLPSLAMLSTLWSDYPVKSLYLGTEMLSMVFCIIIISRVVRFQAFVEGLTLGISAALVITLTSRIYVVDSLSDTYSLIGYFGSKNTVGLLAEIGMVCSSVTIFMRGSWQRKLMLSLLPLALCALCLMESRSATSMLSVIVAFGVMGWLTALMHLPKTLKRIAVLCTILFVFVTVSVGIAIKGGDLVLAALGKDSTLTGRTYLWNEGYKIGMERPVFGHGYSAFWVAGQPLAERYWYEFKVFSRTGFHFHNIYIQTFVDLGLVGVAIVLLQILVACYVALRVGLSSAASAEVVCWTGLVFMFLVRSLAEVDFLAAYTFGMLLLTMAFLRLTQLRRHRLRDAQGVLAQPQKA